MTHQKPSMPLSEDVGQAPVRPAPLTKAALAALYFPKSLPETAVRHLMRWIHYCKPLQHELARSGYYSTQKAFTAKQVATIYEYLGEP